MQRLKINEDSKDEDDLLEEAIKLAAAEKTALEAAVAEKEKVAKTAAKEGGGDTEVCMHGFVATKKDQLVAEGFMKTFVMAFDSAKDDNPNIWELFEVACEATMEKYDRAVWRDSSKLKLVISLFLCHATQQVLEGDIGFAQLHAFFACYLRELFFMRATKATLDLTKMVELMGADEHALVKYLRKSIPCNCLDGKYEEVKSKPKMGLCCNLQCSIPNRVMELSKMVYCTRCRIANYCSRECQDAAWPIHEEFCDAHA